MSTLRPTRAQALAADAADPLAACRDRFELPTGVIYLDGNSLGALPRGVADHVSHVVRTEWGQGLIGSWNDADWIGAPQRIGARLAPLVGAHDDEVIVCDSTSLNLAKLLHAALSLRPGRRVVLTETGNFPTDRYLLDQVARDRDARVVAVDGTAIAGALEHGAIAVPDASAPERSGRQAADISTQDIAVVVLSHVDYRSGRRHDLAAITAAAHRCGALVLWDLAHSAGLLPLQLSADQVDLAVGCGYKWLNGGPGAPGFLYAARRWHAELVQPLVGWMGHREPFAFSPAYEPAHDLRRLLVGTPPIVALAALEAALAAFDGLELAGLHDRNAALARFALDLLGPLQARHRELQIVTPADPAERGGHLSLRHPEAGALSAALIDRGVVGDHRPPDLVRWAFSPLYTRWVDVFDAVEILADALDQQAWAEPRYRLRRTVT